MNNEERDRVPSQGERPEESRFWERYWEAVRRRRVKPGKEKWYELHCVRFIRWLKPRRIREAVAKDVTEWLRLMRKTKKVPTTGNRWLINGWCGNDSQRNRNGRCARCE